MDWAMCGLFHPLEAHVDPPHIIKQEKNSITENLQSVLQKLYRFLGI
jgi:hypothetical protein